MNSELERTIIHFYPKGALTSPLDDPTIDWTWDPRNEVLKALLADLQAIDPEVRPGTRGDYVISEEQIVGDDLRIQLSYLGPYAALNYRADRDLDEDRRERLRRVEKVLEKHGYLLIREDDLEERVPWIRHGGPATAWNCLFEHPI